MVGSAGHPAAGTRHQRACTVTSVRRLCHTSRTLTSLSSPVWATKITSADGQASMAAKAPPARGGSRLGIAAARSARSAWPPRRRRAMPRRQRCGVQFPPSGNSSSASRPPRPTASRLICLIWSAWGLPPVALRPADAGAGERRMQERVGHPVGHDVQARVQLEGGLHDHPGMPAADREQVVDDEQRVAGARVPAQHDDRAVVGRRRSSGGPATSTRSPQARSAAR